MLAGKRMGGSPMNHVGRSIPFYPFGSRCARRPDMRKSLSGNTREDVPIQSERLCPICTPVN
jgi:hypothetical protein